MFQFASKIMLVASILRIVAAAVIVAAIAFGIYSLFHNEIILGLLWIVCSVACGWVGNIVFNLVLLLTSAAAGPHTSKAR